ncbi:AbrB/MazE/SpoVT family DNA-binding domain-containing protein [Aquibium carbonis]|uniref:AbrB/MazE/SpoVT family DNA-binding domain-containing protein n=1 Tax=Aquibium carbonis TaxID=2495581 RepID=A0A429Z3B3_9HYPH|nr:AbrB/MazE/SpoVT family DNA-binding domain-containing protein [Aquibium carbonis]RST88206.1 AbrB/MazE/SpoVT family DNA-binding domain-containing protein [Aquibium carbonis]
MSAKTYESRITSKGQTTIPVEVRERLGVGPGDSIQFVLIDGHYEIIPRNRPVEILFGRLQDYAMPDTSLADYRDAVEEYFAGQDGDRGDKDEAA